MEDAGSHPQGTGDESGKEVVKVDFYDCDRSADTLTHETVQDAVEAWLCELGPNHWPDTLIVYAFRRERRERQRGVYVGLVLDVLVEQLDEDSGNPDETDIKDDWVLSAKAFVDKVLETYKPWRCEEVPEASVVVNVASWIRENKPGWLGDGSIRSWISLR